MTEASRAVTLGHEQEPQQQAVPAVASAVGAQLSVGLTADVVRQLQGSAGNRAVTRALQPAAGTGEPPCWPRATVGSARLSRAERNAAVERLIQRDTPAATGQLPADAPLAAPENPVEGLQLGLRRHGRASLWSLLDGQQLTLTPPLPLPRLLPGGGAATQMVFGPLSNDAALRALPHVRERPDWFAEMLRPREQREPAAELYIVYENDGGGIFPNFGLEGSDQGRTAALYIYALFNQRGTGLSRLGVTPIEMTTPRGTLPAGAPENQTSTYETAAGPYSGVASIDVGVTVSRSGSSSVELLGSVGVDSREWGELVQGIIHREVSDSPIFPWPSGSRPLLEGGIRWNRTINELTQGEFAGLRYTGRLELGAGAVTGTRRTEAGADARFVIRTANLHTPVGAISFEVSPIGLFTRGFLRYNDGREAPLAGVEGGVTGGFMVNIGRVGVGLQGAWTASTDPAFQTGLPAGEHPPGLAASPTVGTDQAGNPYGMPAGAHPSGQLILKFAF